MEKPTLEHLILQILAGSPGIYINEFIIVRESRGLSQDPIKYYSIELRLFREFLDDQGIINLD
jgi:hypothetical protein